ncbi:MAG: glutathione-dependent formaldehyde dehydrogenase [Planctomycetes bacterium GWF2_41_51]|nr:MAG: glutathione-dependent formaldehyde dehydrogenase [Planctomycetes bacterium GWF2_41_51]
MKAIVFQGIGDIVLDDVEEPKLQHPQDAIVRITASAICGTDLHIVRGTLGPMIPGTILGHEGVGVVEQVGREVRNFRPGDRVVIASTIACGFCSYCRSGYYSQCDNANPNGPKAGTCFFGGPQLTGPIDGLQAEKARVPFANVGLVKIPDDISDREAIVLSDILPTGYYGADMARIRPGSTVAVFGCGPVGLFAIKSAFLMGAAQVFAIDRITERLEIAQKLGGEIIDFDSEDPIEAVFHMTGGIGVDRVIDAVGIDASHPTKGPGWKHEKEMKQKFKKEVNEIAPEINPEWPPGEAPSQVLHWAIKIVAKAGTLSLIGVYPQTMQHFPIGEAMNKNLKINMGNCNHRKYIPMLMELIQNGEIKPQQVITNVEPLTAGIEAYKAFDERRQGWVKVELITSKS